VHGGASGAGGGGLALSGGGWGGGWGVASYLTLPFSKKLITFFGIAILKEF